MKTLLTILSLLTVSCTCFKQVKTVPVKTFQIRTTAYCGAGEKDHIKYGNKTAIGTPLKKDKSIAADISIFPIGTKMKIGEIVYEVDDYGSALIHEKEKPIPTIDIYKTSRKQMNKWGVKYFSDVEIIEWGSFEESAKLLKDRLHYSHCRLMYMRIIQQKL